MGTRPIPPSQGKEYMLRDKFVGMRDEGLLWGTSSEVPFERARVTPVFDIPKEKDNPESDRIRPIYH